MTSKVCGMGVLTAAVAAACGLAIGFSQTATAAGTVNVGLSTALSGPVAYLGTSNEHGISLAIDEINAHGGLLGNQIKLVTADSLTTPNTGVTNVRNFALSDRVKAVFGPVSSAVGAAEGQIAAQYRIPIFFTVSNDVDQTGKYFSKYAFQLVPDTHMEPYAIAAYVAAQAKAHHWKTYYTISPNYSFGHSTVDDFLAGMKKFGASVDLVGQQWPALGASDFTQYISAITAKEPNFIFMGQYGGDLVTLSKQGDSSGMFGKAAAYGGYWLGAATALGASAPAGVISSDRAPPFYLHPSKEMQAFTAAYHKKFNQWPSAWAILGYSAVQTWAQGVKKANSFDGDKVSAALSGAAVKTVQGDVTLRSCDHMAQVPEYLGVLSKTVNTKYGIRELTDVVAEPPAKIMMSCKAKVAMQAGH